jgi:hypothetical protein
MKLSEKLRRRRTQKIKRIEQRLADAADREGMTVEDIARRSDLCETYGVDQSQLTGALVHRAHELLRAQITETMQRLAALYHQRGTPDPDTESDELESRLARLDKKKPKKKRPATSGAKARTKVFGHPVTAVLRWMGKRNWSVEEAQKALKHFGAEAASSTCKIQLKAGKTGSRGEPAKLTRNQSKKLKELRNA